MALGLEAINRSPDELPQENTFANVLQRRRMLQALMPPVQVQPSVEEQYMQEVQNYPRYENYQPSRLRKVLGTIAGLSGKPGSQRAVTDAPYYQSLIPYQQRLSALETGAKFGMSQEKAAAERFKNVMQGRQYEAEAAIQPARGEYFSGTGSLRRALGAKVERTYVPSTLQEAIQLRGAGRAPSLTMEDRLRLQRARDEAAMARERLRQSNANARAKDRKASTKYISPAAQKTAESLATQEILNRYPEAEKYFTHGVGGVTEIKPPEAGWFSDVSPEEQAEFEALKAEYDEVYNEILNRQYGTEDENDEEFEGGEVQ